MHHIGWPLFEVSEFQPCRWPGPGATSLRALPAVPARRFYPGQRSAARHKLGYYRIITQERRWGSTGTILPSEDTFSSR